MPFIRIDNREVDVPTESSILAAACKLGIDIPTLCHMDGFSPFTSCMVCLVEDMASHRLLPSCSAPVQNGMVVETNNERVREARRDMLELLLREHVGDCESPCMRACPVHLDIPVVLRQLAAGIERESSDIQWSTIPFLTVLEHICPAPCERACRRRIHDEAVSIRLSMRSATLHTEGRKETVQQQPTGNSATASKAREASGKNVAIITDAGGPGIMAADECESMGLNVEKFSSETIEKFEGLKRTGKIPSFATNLNPLDLTGSVTSAMYEASAEILLEDPEIHGIIVLGLHHTPGLLEDFVDRVAKLSKNQAKPVVACDIGETEMAMFIRSRFDKFGIPAYSSPEDAARAMAALSKYGLYLRKNGCFVQYMKSFWDRAKV